MVKNPPRRRGFTLIELLVVISILGILMALLLPAAGGAIDAAKRTQAKNDVTQLATAMTAFEAEYGVLPTSAGTGPVGSALLDSLTNSKGSATNNPRGISFLEVAAFKKGKGGVSNNTYLDPWGNAYYYSADVTYSGQVSVSTNGTTSPSFAINKKVGVWNITTTNRRMVRSWD